MSKFPFLIPLLIPFLIAVGCQTEIADPNAPHDPSIPVGPTAPGAATAAADDPTADVLKSYPLVGALLLGNRAKSFDADTLQKLVDIDNAGKAQALKAAVAFDSAAGLARGDLATGAISQAHIDALVAADRALREVALNALVEGMQALPAGRGGSAPPGGEAPRAVSGTLGLLVSAEGRSVPEQPGNAAYAKVMEAETARSVAWAKAFSTWMMTVSSARGSEGSAATFTAATRALFDAGDASMRARLTLAPQLLSAASNPAELLGSERFSAWLNLTWEGKPRAEGLPVPVVSSETPAAGSAPNGLSAGMMPPGMTPGSMQPGMTPGSMQPGMTQGSMQPGMTPGSMQPGMTQGSMQPGMTPGSMQPGMTQGSMQPGMTPGSMQPGMTPGSMQPGMTPGSMQPGASQQAPGAMQPGASQQVPGKPPG